MPKRIEDVEPYEEPDEDEGDEGEEYQEPAAVQRGRGRPRKLPPPQPRPPRTPQVRYTAFKQEAAEGIIDRESNEVIATDINTALANIIERLERIENNIGAILER